MNLLWRMTGESPFREGARVAAAIAAIAAFVTVCLYDIEHLFHVVISSQAAKDLKLVRTMVHCSTREALQL